MCIQLETKMANNSDTVREGLRESERTIFLVASWIYVSFVKSKWFQIHFRPTWIQEFTSGQLRKKFVIVVAILDFAEFAK